MAWYVARRCASALATLLAISVVAFILVRLLPGSPATAILGQRASQDLVDQVNHQLGLDRPALVQYWSWLTSVLHGDFGHSLASAGTSGQVTGVSVSSIVIEGLKVTVPLSVLSIALAAVIGIPMGVLAARRRGSTTDSAIAVISVLFLSLPDFFLSFLLVLAFTVVLPWFPSVGYPDPFSDPVGAFESLVLPVVAVGIINSTSIARSVRNTVADALDADYVQLANAKGEGGATVTLRHGLRSSLIPVVTVVGLQFGYLCGGVIVVESVFSLPGDGRQLLAAVNQRDYPTIQALMMLFAAFFVLTNLVVDFLYPLLDPRVAHPRGAR